MKGPAAEHAHTCTDRVSLCALCPQNLKDKIDKQYRINMILDNLPVTVYDLLDEVSTALELYAR